MWKLTDTLLLRKAKLTNTTLPHSYYINSGTYPAQNQNLVAQIVEIKYRNYYRVNTKEVLEQPAITEKDGVKISLRPHDDTQFLEPIELPDIDMDSKDVWEDEFLILRADLDEPNVLIAISLDCSVILVGSTKTNELHHYDFIDNIYIYPLQKNEFFNVPIQTHYMNDKFVGDVYYNAIALRVDDVDPAEAIIMEYLDEETVRFVLADEVTVIDNNDVDDEDYVNDFNIADYRKNLLEGKIIYGTV